MMTTLKTALTVTLVAAVAAGAGISPARALQPCRPPLPAFSAYPKPMSKTPVPTNATIFLYHRSQAKLTLQEKLTRKPVPFKLLVQPGSFAARMVPDRPLKPGTVYVVRGKRGVVKDIPYTLSIFTTSNTAARAQTPSIRSAKVRFSRVQKRRRFHSIVVSGGGRSARLHLTAGPVKPAAVELDITFSRRRKGPFIRNHVFHTFVPTIYFAAPGPCARWMTRVFNYGRYVVRVTPWSATGVKGKTLTLKGRIR